jgi:hypothetical protein
MVFISYRWGQIRSLEILGQHPVKLTSRIHIFVTLARQALFPRWGRYEHPTRGLLNSQLHWSHASVIVGISSQSLRDASYGGAMCPLRSV